MVETNSCRFFPGWRWLAALLLLIAALPAATLAMSVEPMDFAKLVAGSEAVVKAEILEVRGAWVGEGADRRIMTTVRLRVRETAKGAPKTGEEMGLEFLGGRADGKRMVVFGMPEFRVGDTEILFVQTADRPICPLAGVHHGRVQLRRDSATGREEAFRHDGVPLTATTELGGASDAQRAPRPEAGKPAMTSDELLNAVRAEVTRTSSTGR